MAHDVFISYATRDKQTADALCARLEAAGIRCWIAPRDVRVGSDWASAIVAAIESSRVLVLVFSSECNASPHVAREVEVAIRSGVVLAPFRIEQVEPHGSLSYYIANAHWLDAVTPPLEAHAATLATMLAQLIDSQSPSTSTEHPQDSGDSARPPGPPPRADDAAPPAEPPRPVRNGPRPSKGVVIAVGAALMVVVLALVVAGVALLNDNSAADSAVCERGVKWRQADAPYPDGAPVITTDGAVQRAAIVVGGARFGFPNEQEYTELLGSERPQGLTPAEYHSIGLKPRDGLLVRERTLDYNRPGRLFLAEGGAMFQVRDPSSLSALGLRADDAFVVPTHGLDELPTVPVAGTLLRLVSSNETWVVSGGVRRIADRVCSGATINRLPDDPHVLDAIATAPGQTP